MKKTDDVSRFEDHEFGCLDLGVEAAERSCMGGRHRNEMANHVNDVARRPTEASFRRQLIGGSIPHQFSHFMVISRSLYWVLDKETQVNIILFSMQKY
jgi:hypothetical protein